MRVRGRYDMPKDTNKDNKVISPEITEATQQAMAEEVIPADGTGSEEYEAAVRDFLANKDKLMEEVQLLREQSEEMLTDIPSNEEDNADDTSDDMTDVTDDVPDADDSGHIADVISEDGEAVSGAVIWSSSGRKFIVMSADGSPVSDLEAEQAMELIDSKRIAFDNADDHERFVSKMSAMGVDVDQDKVDVSQDGSTGELLVDPEELIGNERHHMSGEHAGKNVAWDDEVDLNDPESTGPQRIEQILRGQETAGATETAQGKISGLKVYRADNIMTFVSVLLIVTFYILVIVFQQPSPFMLGVWSTLCVAATTAVMMPFTMSMETREKMIGGKFLLTGSLCIVFFVMSLLLLIDAAIANRSQWQPGVDVPQQVTGSETADEPPVMLDFEPSGDVVVLEMTGTPGHTPPSP